MAQQSLSPTRASASWQYRSFPRSSFPSFDVIPIGQLWHPNTSLGPPPERVPKLDMASLIRFFDPCQFISKSPLQVRSHLRQLDLAGSSFFLRSITQQSSILGITWLQSPQLYFPFGSRVFCRPASAPA